MVFLGWRKKSTEATAYKNSITTVPLLCDGFRPMGESLQARGVFGGWSCTGWSPGALVHAWPCGEGWFLGENLIIYPRFMAEGLVWVVDDCHAVFDRGHYSPLWEFLICAFLRVGGGVGAFIHLRGTGLSRLQVLASFWGPEQMQMLANHGISLVVPGAQKVRNCRLRRPECA